MSAISIKNVGQDRTFHSKKLFTMKLVNDMYEFVKIYIENLLS